MSGPNRHPIVVGKPAAGDIRIGLTIPIAVAGYYAARDMEQIRSKRALSYGNRPVDVLWLKDEIAVFRQHGEHLILVFISAYNQLRILRKPEVSPRLQ